MEAVIFVGLQGAGKSTFFQKMFSSTHARISLDELKTRPREMARITSCLAERLNFVVDNTNPTMQDRKRYIQLAKAAGYSVVGYFFECAIRDCLKRNQLRSGKAKVPPPAVFSTRKRMQPPSFEEGFDALFRVQVSSEGQYDVQTLVKGREGEASG
jgi:predicted kinase